MTIRRAFYYYERTFKGTWSQNVHYDEPPRKLVNGTTPERSAPNEIYQRNRDEFDRLGEPLWGSLRKKFPPPETSQTSDAT